MSTATDQRFENDPQGFGPDPEGGFPRRRYGSLMWYRVEVDGRKIGSTRFVSEAGKEFGANAYEDGEWFITRTGQDECGEVASGQAKPHMDRDLLDWAIRQATAAATRFILDLGDDE